MNTKHQRNTPPPPYFLIRNVLICFLFLIAVPVQSQTPVPTVPPRLTNPTVMAPCGLPASYAEFDADATVTTFNMTADCAFNSWSVAANDTFLWFTAGGEFTINGNGHSIIGPTNAFTIYVQDAGTVLNLNNVTIRGNTAPTAVVNVTGSARLNGRRVIFSDNAASGSALSATAGGEARLEDAQFLGNSVANDTGIASASGGSIVITNGLFARNSASIGKIIRVSSAGSFSGSSLTFSDNSARTVIESSDVNSQVTLRNVQFLNNSQTAHTEQRGSAVTSRAQSAVTITNGIFRANQNVAGRTDVIVSFGATGAVGTVQLQGCMTFESNVQSDGSTAANDYGAYNNLGMVALTGLITDSSAGSCPAGIGFIPLSLSRPKKKAKEAEPTPTPTPRPAYGASYVALQTATGMTFEATYGLDSGVHFRQLDGAGIGIQSIIDAGYLAALDVYGYVEQGVEVCFPQIGRVIFLDARTMPRAITPLESTVRDGMTCVYLDSPGSLVLLPN